MLSSAATTGKYQKGTTPHLMIEHPEEFRTSKDNTVALECPNNMEEDKATSDIFVHEVLIAEMRALDLGKIKDSQNQVQLLRCCEQAPQQYTCQSNMINDDELDNTEAPTAGEYVTANG